MTVRLTVHSARWRSHVDGVVAAVDGLIPVVKGNGYGFGRRWLAGFAAELSDTVAVGTVHEVDDVPAACGVVVLTPTLDPPDDTRAVLTVGSDEHIARLRGWEGHVIVKIESTVRRFGRGVELIDAARRAGLDVIGVSVHPPLAGSSSQHRAEIERLLPAIDEDLSVWLSHVDPVDYRALPDTHRYRLRLGTALWHGDKSMVRLDADVLDRRPVRNGDRAGYRQGTVDVDGHLVVIGAGTAAGVAPLPDGTSPFHFGRRRLPLHEPPHMHVSMVVIADGDPLPDVGDWVDLQRPLTTTTVDRFEWT